MFLAKVFICKQTMDEQNRKILVELQMERAHRFLKQADEMYSLQHWDINTSQMDLEEYITLSKDFIKKIDELISINLIPLDQ